jgi:anaerobic selenocysteine-containing dehydrogenase
LFTVVLDPLMTDTANYADLVLPATTEFEHLDVNSSYWHLYVQLSEQAIAPVGESKSNFEVFGLLARGMGFNDDCFGETPEEAIAGLLSADHPFLSGINLERLRREGWVHLNTPASPFIPFLDGRFPTPSGKIEFYSGTLAAQGHDPLPAHVPLAESREATPGLFASYPLNLITPGAHHFLNSSFGELERMRAKEGAPTIELHSADAASRQLIEGDWARVFNNRGECYMQVRVGHSVPEGTACSVSVWWNRFSPGGGNCNQLTSDNLSDFGRGATFHTNLVQVEKAVTIPATPDEETRLARVP